MPRTSEIESFRHDISIKQHALSILFLLILFTYPLLSQVSNPDKISDLLLKIDASSMKIPSDVYLEFKEVLRQAPSSKRILGIHSPVLLCMRSEINASTNCPFKTVSDQAQEWINLYQESGVVYDMVYDVDSLQIEASACIYALYSKKNPVEFARYIDKYIQPLIEKSPKKKDAFSYYGFYYSSIFNTLDICPKEEGRAIFKNFMKFLPLYLASSDISDLNKGRTLTNMGSYCMYWGHPEIAEKVIDTYMKDRKVEAWPPELLFRKFLLLILGHGDRKSALEYLKVMENKSLLNQLTGQEEENYQIMIYQINKHMLYTDQQLIEKCTRTINKRRSNYPNMEYILCVK